MLPPPLMSTTRSITRIVALAGVLVLLAGGCSRAREVQLPVGDDLLRAAAQEMRGVESVAFDLDVAGPLGSPGIRRAKGVLNGKGEASGTVILDDAGTPVEYEVVITGEQAYFKGPTGGFQAVPSSIAASLYDPKELLNPSGGLAGVLRETSGGRTEAADPVDGTASYRVSATIASGVLERLLPVRLQEDKVPTLLWIGKDQPLLRKIRLVARLAGQPEPTTLTVTLSNFNAPVDITPPPT